MGFDRLLVRPAGRRDAFAQVGECLVGHVDTEGYISEAKRAAFRSLIVVCIFISPDCAFARRNRPSWVAAMVKPIVRKKPWRFVWNSLPMGLPSIEFISTLPRTAWNTLNACATSDVVPDTRHFFFWLTFFGLIHFSLLFSAGFAIEPYRCQVSHYQPSSRAVTSPMASPSMVFVCRRWGNSDPGGEVINHGRTLASSWKMSAETSSSSHFKQHILVMA